MKYDILILIEPKYSEKYEIRIINRTNATVEYIKIKPLSLNTMCSIAFSLANIYNDFGYNVSIGSSEYEVYNYIEKKWQLIKPLSTAKQMINNRNHYITPRNENQAPKINFKGLVRKDSK